MCCDSCDDFMILVEKRKEKKEKNRKRKGKQRSDR
jgi:hypothetical protein